MMRRMPFCDATRDGCVLRVVVAPRASRTEIAGEHGDALKIRLAAPPVDGAANDELVAFLADRLGIPRAAIRIAAGASGRRKSLRIEGVSPDQAASRLTPRLRDGVSGR